MSLFPVPQGYGVGLIPALPCLSTLSNFSSFPHKTEGTGEHTVPLWMRPQGPWYRTSPGDDTQCGEQAFSFLNCISSLMVSTYGKPKSTDKKSQDWELQHVLSIGTMQKNFLWLWKCSLSAVPSTIADDLVWLLSPWNVASALEGTECLVFINVNSLILIS